MDSKLMLLAMLALPFAGAAAVALRAPGRTTALGVSGLVLVLAVLAGLDMPAGVRTCNYSWPWLETGGVKIAFAVGLNGLNYPLVLLASIVGVAAVLVAPREVERAREYYAHLMLILGGAVGAFLSTDLFFLYVFHEVALVPTFLMMIIWGKGPRKMNSAWTMAAYLFFGSMVLLVGLIAFLAALPEGQRTTDLVALHQLARSGFALTAAQQSLVFALVGIGFGVLVGLFPFHSWAPQGYSAAPTPVAMLHAGVLKKFGIYGLIQLALVFCPEGLTRWACVAGWLVAGNLLVMAWVAIAQKRLDDLLGNSSVMHMGYLFLGLLAATQGSVTGVVLLMVGHGLSVAGLFAVNGFVESRAGTVEIGRLGGLAVRFPLVAFAFTVFAMASIGLPGLANFPGEVSIFLESFAKFPGLTVLAVLGVVFSAIYMLRAVRGIFHGEAVALEDGVAGTTLAERAALVLLMAALLLFGFAPGLLAGPAGEALKFVMKGAQ
jgi:NADH-quinone oxidoreductase subunit M